MNNRGIRTFNPNHRTGGHWILLLLFSTVFDCLLVASSPKSSSEWRHSTRSSPSLDARQYKGLFSVLGIAGLEEQDGTAHPRLEIRELEKEKTLWSVFILGLQRFQNASQSDTLSYFQIAGEYKKVLELVLTRLSAGIHGRPWVAWDNVEGNPNSLQHGYCQHSSALFPSWHRPYLALFEVLHPSLNHLLCLLTNKIQEMLYLNARQVISEFPAGTLKDDYIAALHELRLPYWDWAAIPPVGEGSLPHSLQQPTLTIDVPGGPTEIANPLYSFTFHSIPDWEAEDDERWKMWQRTLRHPTTLDSNAVSQNAKIAGMLDGNRPSMQTRVFGLLALQHDYLPMSNKLQPGDSLESIHGTIHDMVGGDGHMLWLQYSAYDPIFWLHHTNVDRLIAIWQELNRESWLATDSTNEEASFAISSGTVVNGKTPLKPFRKSDSRNDFWTSEDVRDWRVFGYTYNDVQNLTDQDTLISRVNTLYGPEATPRSYKPSTVDYFNQTYGPSPPPPSVPAPPPYLTSPDIKTTAAHTNPPKLRKLMMRKHMKRSIELTNALSFTHRRQYTIHVSLYASSIKGSLKFYFFLADPVSTNVDSWVEEAGFVGFSSILATTSSSTVSDDDDSDSGYDGKSSGGKMYGDRDKKKANTIVPLTAALEGKIREGELQGLEEDDVRGFLGRRLRWRVVIVSFSIFSPLLKWEV
ncbi:unnamed protein product [Periconia digitata]|uniref:tyrosinase n=1 Tax=Periconia digitata TaxID=1303443 RepID=A0A9W4XKP6_9PLEO|nr:unnamed protein product [Periconia digitata]